MALKNLGAHSYIHYKIFIFIYTSYFLLHNVPGTVHTYIHVVHIYIHEHMCTPVHNGYTHVQLDLVLSYSVQVQKM
jgi:hypothetical protein